MFCAGDRWCAQCLRNPPMGFPLWLSKSSVTGSPAMNQMVSRGRRIERGAGASFVGHTLIILFPA
jgi:hypothetical protein